MSIQINTRFSFISLQKLFVVFVFGFSSGLPFSLVSSTLQAWFASEGFSIFNTSIISLIGLPYLFRFLWAPFLDHYSLSRFGKRRSWIFLCQIVIFLLFNLLSFFSPKTLPWFIIILSFIVAISSATANTVIDAHRIEYLAPREHGLGAAIAVFGYRLALLISGGMALILAANYGWALMYQIMSFLMILCLTAVFISPEPENISSTNISLKESLIEPIKELLSRKNFTAICCFIIFYKLASALTNSNSGIMMSFLIQGLDFSITDIAWVNKIIGTISSIAGSLLAGFFLLYWRLSSALWIFGILQVAGNLIFIYLAYLGKNINFLIIAVGLDNFSAGLAATALVSFIMQMVDKRFTATEFSIFIALASLPLILSGPIGAILEIYMGWTGMFIVSFILSFLFIPFLFKIQNNLKLISIRMNS